MGVGDPRRHGGQPGYDLACRVRPAAPPCLGYLGSLVGQRCLSGQDREARRSAIDRMTRSRPVGDVSGGPLRFDAVERDCFVAEAHDDERRHRQVVGQRRETRAGRRSRVRCGSHAPTGRACRPDGNARPNRARSARGAECAHDPIRDRTVDRDPAGEVLDRAALRRPWRSPGTRRPRSRVWLVFGRAAPISPPPQPRGRYRPKCG